MAPGQRASDETEPAAEPWYGDTSPRHHSQPGDVGAGAAREGGKRGKETEGWGGEAFGFEHLISFHALICARPPSSPPSLLGPRIQNPRRIIKIVYLPVPSPSVSAIRHDVDTWIQ